MDIPSQYNPKEVEGEIYAKWVSQGSFCAKVDPAKKPFTIVIPPPNVTGILHMGHALNNTIQDVLIRYQRMRGFESLWMPGTDHAGIATQNVVEKQLAKEKISKVDIGREEFTRRLWAWTDKHGTTILEQLKKIGASCDWDRTRFTMDASYSAAVKEVFIRLYQEGLIYRGKRIINWCPRCLTALSDEEAPHRELDGWLYYIKYPVIAGNQQPATRNQKEGYIVVATTRPETMLGDTAVAINPNDERYQYLKTARVVLPIVERGLKVVLDEAVDPAFGTGIAKVTPAHDPVDFALGKKHGLEFINIMNDNASLNENVPEDFRGMDRFEARQALLELLDEKKLIDKKEPYKLSAGHCYRCHTIIEPRISPQWFVKTKPLAMPAIRAVEEDKIKFTPVRWRKVYLNWMNNIQDWCISRQIWWGHRVPAYYCKKCFSPERETGDQRPQTIDFGFEEINTKGIIVAKEKPVKCPECGGTDIEQDPDVLDTWFSSWLWPFATFYWPFEKTSDQPAKPSGGVPPSASVGGKTIDLGKNLTASPKISDRSPEELRKELDYFYPTSVLVTASEILFFWVARMIMAGLHFKKAIPFKDVFIHGTVRDAQGIKMSKSLGNIIDPLAIIDKFGADSLRFSLMMLASGGSDVYLSDQKFLVGRNFCNKIWNASRFLLMKVEEKGYDLRGVRPSPKDPVDQWILLRLKTATQAAAVSLDSLAINDAAKMIYEFFWGDFCDWYVEIVKDDFDVKRAAFCVYILVESLKLIHPFMPFISEKIFGFFSSVTGEKNMLVHCAWPSFAEATEGMPAQVRLLEDTFATIAALRNLKADIGLANQRIGLKARLSTQACPVWEKNRAWITRLSASSDISLAGEALPRALYKNELGEFDLAVADLDLDPVKAALDKKIATFKASLAKSEGRLNNEKFLEKALAETIAEEKGRSQQMTTQLKRLEELRKALQ